MSYFSLMRFVEIDDRHCEAPEGRRSNPRVTTVPGLLRRFAPRNDGSPFPNEAVADVAMSVPQRRSRLPRGDARSAWADQRRHRGGRMAFSHRHALHRRRNGWWLVRFPGIPEALTECEDEAQARANSGFGQDERRIVDRFAKSAGGREGGLRAQRSPILYTFLTGPKY
jgi:hypothetical protein